MQKITAQLPLLFCFLLLSYNDLCAQVQEIYYDSYYRNSLQNIFDALQEQAEAPPAPQLYEPSKSIPLYSGDDYCFRKKSVFKSVIFQWERAGNRSVNDEEAFWKKYSSSNYSIWRYNELGKYLGTEEAQIKAIRTGRELRLYNKIKSWIHHAGANDRIELQDLLTMGLDACKNSRNEANLQETFLTIHNVIRVLGRPATVFAPTKAEEFPIRPPDPIYHVIMDIKDEKSSDGKMTLYDLLKSKPERFPDFQNVKSFHAGPNYTMLTMFGRSNGVFGFLEQCEEAGPSAGAQAGKVKDEEAKWSAGSYYYFWIGALAQSTMGYASLLYGGEQEEFLKWLGSWSEPGLARQGQVEVGHMYCAGTIISELLDFSDAGGAMGILSDPVKPKVKTVSFDSYAGTYGLCYSENSQRKLKVSLDGAKLSFEIVEAGRGQLTMGGGSAYYKGSYKDAIVFKGSARVFHKYKNRFMDYVIEIYLIPASQIDNPGSPWSEEMVITYKNLHVENTPGTPDGGSSYYRIR